MNFSTRICTAALLFVVLTTPHIQSQTQSQNVFPPTESEYFLGVMGGISHLRHSTNLDVLSGQPKSRALTNSSSTGWWVGVTDDFVVAPQLFEISTRLSVASRPLELQQDLPKISMLTNPQTKTYSTLQRTMTYSAGITYVVGDFGFKIRPLSWLGSFFMPLYLRTSVDAAMAIATKNAVQYQEVVAPSELRFSENTSKTLLESSPLQEPELSHGVTVAIGMDIRMNSTLFLASEVSYRYGFNSIRSDVDWRTNALQASVGLRWEFTKSVE